MSRLLARIALTIVIIPLGVAVLFVAVIGIDIVQSELDLPIALKFEQAIAAAGVVAWLVTAVFWVVAWRTQVTWNTLRRWGTIACGAVALLGGLTISWLIEVDDVLIGIVDGLSISLIWLIATTLLWRDTRQEAALRLGRRPVAPSCPNCGYNMTGLRETRCPECGTLYTLSELLIRQRWRLARLEQAEIERMLQ